MIVGKFITLEGIDGAGKSTHLAWLAEYLRGKRLPVTVTREPGGTPLGEKLRELLLHEVMHAETEALLMFAARCEHVQQVIRPALQQGAWVVCDRFSDASFAYQGGGRGLPAERLELLERWVHADLQPHLTLLFDVPLAVSQARLANNTSLDRFEQERGAFFERVRAAYHVRAAQFPQRFRVVDSTRSIETIRAELQAIVDALI
ncbi:MAG: dTMP kinase [Pseudomonadota bacterium]